MSGLDEDGFRRTPEHRCPYCNNKLTALGTLTTHDTPKPEPGDASVCMYCVQVVVFDRQLVPRQPSPGEMEAAFAADPEFAESIERTRQAVRANQPGRA